MEISTLDGLAGLASLTRGAGGRKGKAITPNEWYKELVLVHTAKWAKPEQEEEEDKE